MSIFDLDHGSVRGDRTVAQLAEAQGGLVTRGQLLAAGVSTGAIQRRLDRGQVVAVHPGVYRIGGVPPGPAIALRAACLAAGPGSCVSHRAAAAAWGCWGGTTPCEVTTRRERGPGLAGVTCHRSRDLADDHVLDLDGLPVTTPVRTLVDIGQVVSWQTVREVMDRFLARKLVTPEAIEAGLAMHGKRGRRGIGPLRRAVAAAGLVHQPDASVLARMFVRLCADAGLPVPVVEHGVDVGGRRRWIDVAYPGRRLAVEIDGYEWHGSPSAFESDRMRGNELAVLGWTVLHFTWHQIVHRPDYVIAVMRRALA